MLVLIRKNEFLTQTKDLNNLNVGESGDNSRDYSGLRKIFSIFLPFASSSINLSKYRIFCINGSSISSTRIPQTTPLIKEAFGFILGACRRMFENPSSPGSVFPNQPYYIQSATE